MDAITKQSKAFGSGFRPDDVGHKVVVGATSAHKSVPEKLVKLWAVGHSGGNISQAGMPITHRRRERHKEAGTSFDSAAQPASIIVKTEGRPGG